MGSFVLIIKMRATKASVKGNLNLAYGYVHVIRLAETCKEVWQHLLCQVTDDQVKVMTLIYLHTT